MFTDAWLEHLEFRSERLHRSCHGGEVVSDIRWCGVSELGDGVVVLDDHIRELLTELFLVDRFRVGEVLRGEDLRDA